MNKVRNHGERMDKKVDDILNNAEKQLQEIEKDIIQLRKLIGFKSANENIAEHVSEKYLLRAEKLLVRYFNLILQTLLIDTEEDYNVIGTPRRLAKMYIHEILAGRYQEPPKICCFPNVHQKSSSAINMIGPIRVRSLCAHHFLPINGYVWCGVVYGEKLLGLSKFKRIVEWVMTRPQIQEEAVEQLADEFERYIQPRGTAIYMQAAHSCMLWRGVKAEMSQFSNYTRRGLFADSEEYFSSFMRMVALQIHN